MQDRQLLFEIHSQKCHATGLPLTSKLVNETEMLISRALTQCHKPTGMNRNLPGSTTRLCP